MCMTGHLSTMPLVCFDFSFFCFPTAASLVTFFVGSLALLALFYVRGRNHPRNQALQLVLPILAHTRKSRCHRPWSEKRGLGRGKVLFSQGGHLVVRRRVASNKRLNEPLGCGLKRDEVNGFSVSPNLCHVLHNQPTRLAVGNHLVTKGNHFWRLNRCKVRVHGAHRLHVCSGLVHLQLGQKSSNGWHADRVNLGLVQLDICALATSLGGLATHNFNKTATSFKQHLENDVPGHHVCLSPAGEALAGGKVLQRKHACPAHVQPVDVRNLLSAVRVFLVAVDLQRVLVATQIQSNALSTALFNRGGNGAKLGVPCLRLAVPAGYWRRALFAWVGSCTVKVEAAAGSLLEQLATSVTQQLVQPNLNIKGGSDRFLVESLIILVEERDAFFV
eukprot:m.273694 g.273694  ORF g.273694 m.273694 type:complete len:389 (-) comp19340_c0_seq17:1284-2450(-)